MTPWAIRLAKFDFTIDFVGEIYGGDVAVPPLKCLVSSGRNGPTLNASRNIVGRDGATAYHAKTPDMAWPCDKPDRTSNALVPCNGPASILPIIIGASTAAQVQNYQLTPKHRLHKSIPGPGRPEPRCRWASKKTLHHTTRRLGQGGGEFEQTVSTLKVSRKLSPSWSVSAFLVIHN